MVSLVHTLLKRDPNQREYKTMTLNVAFQIFIWICLFKINWIESTDCSIDTKPLHMCASKPSVLDTLIRLDNIVSIDENDNSIGIQATISCMWKPPKLNLSTIINK